MGRNVIAMCCIVMCMTLSVANLNAQISLTKPTTTEKEKDDSTKKKKSKVAKQKGSSDTPNRFYLGFSRTTHPGTTEFLINGTHVSPKFSFFGAEIGYYFKRFGIKAKVKIEEFAVAPAYKFGINYLFGRSFELGGGVAINTFRTSFQSNNGQSEYLVTFENNLGYDVELAIRIARRLRLSAGWTTYFIKNLGQENFSVGEYNLGIGYLF